MTAATALAPAGRLLCYLAAHPGELLAKKRALTVGEFYNALVALSADPRLCEDDSGRLLYLEE
jgi:chromosome condensin MukBEF MukE localization factor